MLVLLLSLPSSCRLVLYFLLSVVLVTAMPADAVETGAVAEVVVAAQKSEAVIEARGSEVVAEVQEWGGGGRSSGSEVVVGMEIHKRHSADSGVSSQTNCLSSLHGRPTVARLMAGVEALPLLLSLRAEVLGSINT